MSTFTPLGPFHVPDIWNKEEAQSIRSAVARYRERFGVHPWSSGKKMRETVREVLLSDLPQNVRKKFDRLSRRECTYHMLKAAALGHVCALCARRFVSTLIRTMVCNSCRYTDAGHVYVNQCGQLKMQNNCITKHGVTHATKLEKTQRKKAKTCLQRYGATMYLASSQGKKKARHALQTRYGVSTAAHIPGVVEQRSKTAQQRYGHRLEKVVKKRNAVVLERFGVTNYFASEAFKALNRSRYGYDYRSQNPDELRAIQKKQFTRTTVTVEGRKFVLQGYEHYILPKLVERYGVDAVDNVPQPIPDVKSGRVHHPDFYVSTLDLYIEVKSKWTLLGTKEILKANRRKAIAAKHEGTKLTWIVVYPGKLAIKLPADWYRQSRRELIEYLTNKVT